MKRILVCGGAGFLGSHLCQKLLSKNYQVVALDNFYTGRQENILGFFENKNFTSVRKDIVEPFLVDELGYFDEVYNLACPASPPHYQRDPIYTTKTSVIGTLNLLEYCRITKARFFQASTSEVYGDPKEHPQKEFYWGNVNCTGIRSCYDEGKRCAESLIFDFERFYNLDIRVVRIFNTYGPKMDPKDGRVVSNFITQALRGENITIYGNGKQTRSFCYVDDLIEGLILLMESENGVKGPVNLGNPVEYTMLELAEKVIELCKSKSKVSFKPLPLDDPSQRCPDISKARKYLNWSPKVSLLDGLKETIHYFQGFQ